MKLKNLRLYLMAVIASAVVITACDDDFNEEDFLNLQLDLAEDLRDEQRTRNDQAVQDQIDAINSAGNMVTMTAAIFNQDQEPIEGATVTIGGSPGAAAGGRTAAETGTTDAGGIAEFGLRAGGSFSVLVSSPDIVDITFNVNLNPPQAGVHYILVPNPNTGVSSVVPTPINVTAKVITDAASTASGPTGTITGTVTLQSDVTTAAPEVPQGLTLTVINDDDQGSGNASVDISGPDGSIAADEQNSFGAGGTAGAASATEFQEVVAMADVDPATGGFSFDAPVGIVLSLLIPDVTGVDQTIAVDYLNGAAVTPQITTVVTDFGPNFSGAPACNPARTISEGISSVVATFPAVPPAGRGFTVGANLMRIPRGLRSLAGSSEFIDAFPVDENDDVEFTWSRGEGYQSTPDVAVTGGGGTGAEIEPYLNWMGSGISVTDGGTGFDGDGNNMDTVDIKIWTVDDEGDSTLLETVSNVALTVDDMGAITSVDQGDLSDNDDIFLPEEFFNEGRIVMDTVANFVAEVCNCTSSGGCGMDAVLTITYGGYVDEFIIKDPGMDFTDIPDIALSGGSPTTAATLTITNMAWYYKFNLDNSGITTPYVKMPTMIRYQGINIDGNLQTYTDVDRINMPAADESDIVDVDNNITDFLIVQDDGTFAYDPSDETLAALVTQNRITGGFAVFVEEPEHEQAEATVNINGDGEITGLSNVTVGCGYTSIFDITLTLLGGGTLGDIQLSGFMTDDTTPEVIWDGSSFVVDPGSGLTDNVNQAIDDLGGDGAIDPPAATIDVPGVVENQTVNMGTIDYGTGYRRSGTFDCDDFNPPEGP